MCVSTDKTVCCVLLLFLVIWPAFVVVLSVGSCLRKIDFESCKAGCKQSGSRPCPTCRRTTIANFPVQPQPRDDTAAHIQPQNHTRFTARDLRDTDLCSYSRWLQDQLYGAAAAPSAQLRRALPPLPRAPSRHLSHVTNSPRRTVRHTSDTRPSRNQRSKGV